MNRLLALLLCASSLSIVALAAAKPTPSTISTDEIKPGMKGYGLSVLKGTVPERFDVEVIDVLHDFRPAQDLILIRTPHPLLDRARGVGGMSGSPIYLDGRLAGAYAYGWAYGQDPVVGVTPIANMLAELARPVKLERFPGAKPAFKRPAKRKRRSKRSAGPDPRRATFARHHPGLRPYTGETQVNARSALHSFRDAVQRVEPVGLERATTPIMLGGFSDATATMLAKELEPLGLIATQAGVGGARTSRGEKRFVPGGAIAVQLARGDVSVNGIGTVTHVTRDKRVLAFGHPMLNAGAVGLPTATARILHILVSNMRSFKIGESLQTYGMLVQDRQPAIVVNTDIDAGRIPVHVKIRGLEGAPKTDWNVEVSDSRIIAPMITFSVIANALQAVASDASDVVFTARSRIDIEGHGTVVLNESGFSPSGVAGPEALSQLGMFSLMEAAYANPFETSRVNSIDLDLGVEFRRDVFQIVDAFVTENEVDPGADIQVHARIRRVDHKDAVVTVPVHIPRSAAGKKVQVVLSGGSQVAIRHPKARSFGDLIAQATERYPSTSLVATLQIPDRGLQFAGHTVGSLPESAINALQLRSSTEDGHPFSSQTYAEVPMFDLVVGGAALQLNVRPVARDRIRGE